MYTYMYVYVYKFLYTYADRARFVRAVAVISYVFLAIARAIDWQEPHVDGKRCDLLCEREKAVD